MIRFLCLDIGASSGRAMLANFDGKSVQMDELRRFDNRPVISCTGHYWDVLSILSNIKDALSAAKSKGYAISGLGVDCFGVDFGLLSADGELLGNPRCDTDPRTNGIVAATSDIMSIEALYAETGAQIYDMTTLFQLAELQREGSAALKSARHLLFMPDLINYLLTGERITEFTVASTSLLMSLTGRKWNTGLMNRYGIDPSLFGEITLAGTSLPLCGAIGEELLARKMLVTTVAGHDTASAVIPIPARGHENYAFVSSGTWSVIGAPTPSPVIDMRFAGSISNEGCFDGSNRLVKNIFGMKLLNQLKYSWEMEGKAVSFAQMDACAVESEPFACFIDPENLSFFAGENMPGLIQDYCRRTYQRVPGTVGEFVRAVDESLAFCYKKTLLELEAVSGRKFATLFIVGGGTQNKILSQMAASACGIPVVAAAKESAALGNALMQLMACGELKTAGDLAACVQQSVSSTIYEPTEAARWQEKYADYLDAVRHQI